MRSRALPQPQTGKPLETMHKGFIVFKFKIKILRKFSITPLLHCVEYNHSTFKITNILYANVSLLLTFLSCSKKSGINHSLIVAAILENSMEVT